MQPGHDVDTEGDGDILRITGLPQPGKRTVTVDTDEPDPRKKLIVDEHMDVVSAHLHDRAVRLPSERSRADRSTTGPIRSGRRRFWTF